MTYNGDVIVMDVIPFHDVTDVWTATPSPRMGWPATDPRKITSDKVVDEVVCQCEYANVSVPMQIIENVMKGLIGVAKHAGRVDIIRDLEEHWENYTKSSYSGTAAASMRAALVVARQEICPKESAKYRLCPNCMYRSPKNMLLCPQCKGKFVSAGVVNQSIPVIPIYSKAELDETVREREERLKEENFPRDDDIEQEQEEMVVEEEVKEFSPEDMDHQLREPKVEGVDEHGTTMLEDDDATSYAVNYQRMRRDLSHDKIEPAFCVDPNEKVSKYILFKIAAQIVKAFTPWKTFVFDSNDIRRRQYLREGTRHDVHGSGHPVVVCGPNDDDFELDQGLPVTVGDEAVRQHYQAKHEAGTSKYDGDEMLRRYRFSVVIIKLTEALYRLGYEIEGSFGVRVRIVNKVEDCEGVDALSAGDYQTAQGHVASAMKEAIRVAFKCATYSFFSLNQSREQYRFDMADFQSYTIGKSKSKDIRDQLIHILHYYNDVITVPLFLDLVQKRAEKTEHKPLVLKYIQDTPLTRSRGINALMPIDASAAAANTDVNMTATAVQVIEVEDFPAPEFASSSTGRPPPPPYNPIIEDVPMQDAAGNPGITSPTGAYIETVGEIDKVEQVGSAPWRTSSTYTPVTLTPSDRFVREDAERARPSYVEPTPKAVSQAPKANPVPREKRADKEKSEIKEEPKPERGTSSSSSVPATIMTHEVRSIPQKKSKTETTETTPVEPSGASSSADVSAHAGNVNTATDTAPSAPTDEMWEGYTPTTAATTEAPNVARNTPPPPAPSRLRNQPTQSEAGGKGGKPSTQQKGKPEAKGVWRPRLEPDTADQQVQDPDRAQSRFAPTSTHGKGGKETGKDRSKGGKHSEGKFFHEGKTKSKGKSTGSGRGFSQGGNWTKGKGKRYHDATIEYLSTGIYGPEDAVWYILQANYPDQFNNALTEFWQDDRGEWFVRWRHEFSTS